MPNKKIDEVVFYYVSDVGIDNTTRETIEILRPKIPIRLGVNRQVTKFTIDALLDTGSDKNLFPAAYARNLGLKIEKGKPVKIRGIIGEIDAYTHTANIYIGTRKISTQIDFSDKQTIPLLGREGFLDKIEFAHFNQNKRSVTIRF